MRIASGNLSTRRKPGPVPFCPPQIPEYLTRREYFTRIFLIRIEGGGVQLGPLGTAVPNRPIVPTPGDYDDGEIGGMIGRGNRSTRRKPAPVSLCPPEIPHALPWREPGPQRWEASD
jgi:hypothetical protein